MKGEWKVKNGNETKNLYKPVLFEFESYSMIVMERVFSNTCLIRLQWEEFGIKINEFKVSLIKF